MPAFRPLSVGDPLTGGSIPQPVELDNEAKRGIRILIVDDERTLRESCGSFLRSEGYSIDMCGKGNEALDLLKRRRFDVVLIDQYMSDVSGPKLLEACLAKDPDTIAMVMVLRITRRASLEYPVTRKAAIVSSSATSENALASTSLWNFTLIKWASAAS